MSLFHNSWNQVLQTHRWQTPGTRTMQLGKSNVKDLTRTYMRWLQTYTYQGARKKLQKWRLTGWLQESKWNFEALFQRDLPPPHPKDSQINVINLLQADDAWLKEVCQLSQRHAVHQGRLHLRCTRQFLVEALLEPSENDENQKSIVMYCCYEVH